MIDDQVICDQPLPHCLPVSCYTEQEQEGKAKIKIEKSN